MDRPRLEVAHVFRRYGAAYREQHGASMSITQRRVMTAIEQCRTAALGGHLERCDQCGYERNAFNSCRDRHCPKCQCLARAQWIEDRQSELLEVPYFHLVFTVPEEVAAIACQNKRVVYGILFRTTAETLTTIAADPKHLGAQVGFFAVLHTWGQNLLFHPHLHCVVPGGGPSPDGQRWVSCQPGFFLPVRVLSRLFRRLFLQRLSAAHKHLQFFGNHTPLADPQTFAAYLAPLRKTEWVVYSKPPFGGPAALLASLSRYPHRVAIANSRLLAFDQDGVTFKWKDYRIEGRDRYKRMTLATDEFLRRFPIHLLPQGFHRIRHYGLLAKTSAADNIARARQLLAGPKPQSEPTDPDATDHNQPACPCCGGRMIIIEAFPRGATPRHQPTGPMIRIDTS